jgi:hypothetical protein
MKKITAAQAKIFKAHCEAFKTGKWDFLERYDGNKAAFVAELKAGKTFKYMWDTIAVYHCTITAQLMACPEILNHQTSAYKTQMIRGFKTTLSGLGIE